MDIPFQNKSVVFEDLGKIDYQKAWDYQEKLLKLAVDRKMHNRKNPESALATENKLLFCEHPPVYTLGKSGDLSNLLLSKQELEDKEISFYKINRGGDITYHGPGQIVGYPIFDLENFKPDIHEYLRNLEEAVIRTIADYGLKGDRIDGLTGVWLGKGSDNPRKILAIGVRCSRWVTMHGFAFNVNTDLSYFGHIIPCGIDDKAVTSLESELGAPQDFNAVKEKLKGYLADQFGFNWQ